MEFRKVNNEEELYKSLKDSDLSDFPLADKKEFVSKLRELYLALTISSSQATIYEKYDPKEKATYLYFFDNQGEKRRIDKSFIDENFAGNIQFLFEDLKEKIMTNYENASFITISMANAFSQDCYRDTKADKTLNDFMKWLVKYVNSPEKDHYDFGNNVNDLLMKLTLTDQYDESVQDHFTHAANIFMKFNILDPEVMLETHYFKQFSYEDILKLRDDGVLKNSQIIHAMGEDKYKGAILDVKSSLEFWEDQKNYDIHDFSKKETQNNIRKFQKQLSDLISIPEGLQSIIDLYLAGEIDEDLFSKVFDRIKLSKQSPEHIMGLLKSKMSSQIKVSSEDLLKLYGTKLSGHDCIELANLGKIEADKLIDIVKYKSVKESAPELVINPKELIDFYSPDMLLKMYEKHQITPEFAKKFIKLAEENLDVISQEFLYCQIASKTPNQSVLLDYYKQGLLPPQFLKGFVSSSTIDEMFLDENLSMKDILSLVKSGVIKMEETDKYFTSEEIVSNIVSGNLEEDFLKALDSKFVEAKLKGMYISGKCPTGLFLKAFLDHDVINLETLNKSFEEKEPDTDLLQFISKNSNKEKIKELFTNYHISLEDLYTLLHSEIIDKNTFDDIKSAIDKAEFYGTLAKTQKISVTTSEKPEKSNSSPMPIIPGFGAKSNIDFTLEQDALIETFDTPIFGRDSMPIIESHNTLTGNPTSLNNYIIVPIEKYDLVIFEKFAAGNVLFIMPYQQADYFLHGNLSMLDIDNPDLDDAANRSKKTLRQMESVQLCPHSKHFWKHVIDKASQLSDDARNDLKPKGRYSMLAKKHMEKISKKYDENLRDSR